MASIGSAIIVVRDKQSPLFSNLTKDLDRAVAEPGAKSPTPAEATKRGYPSQTVVINIFRRNVRGGRRYFTRRLYHRRRRVRDLQMATLSDFTWTSGVIIEAVASGVKIVTIAESDKGFASIGCGNWKPLDIQSPIEREAKPDRFGKDPTWWRRHRTRNLRCRAAQER